MGRRKIEIKAIKDDRNRSVTFLKRKGGLFKKAHELSVLCSVDVAVFVFGNNKKLYEYSSADMRDLIARYQFHGGPNEHKGPADFNGGNDDDEDEDGDGSPPQGEHLDQPMMAQPFPGAHAQFPPQIHRHHTPSASPPIPNGAVFPGHPHPHQRSHTPQHVASRPVSRNDRRMGSMGPQGPHPVAYMPTPPIYNPQNQPGMLPHGQYQGVPYAYQPAQQQSQPQAHMEERRPSAPPAYTSQPPAQPVVTRAGTSPPQPAPPNVPQISTTPPVPEQREIQPPPPVEVKDESRELRPQAPRRPLLDTDTAIKKLPQRKGHSIFTPIEENRSILSQHLASFSNEPQNKTGPTSGPSIGANRKKSSPKNSEKGRGSVSSIPETTFTPPSRTNSGTTSSARPRGPRLTVQIPDGASEAGSPGDKSVSPNAMADPNEVQGAQRQNSHSSIVLPPPSPSASALLSAGATGPPNPFAKPPPQQNVAETPASALPSRFLGNEFLPSPSSFYNDWNFRASDNNTLPSPLNFATPVGPSGPSFLRDDNATTTTAAGSSSTATAGPPKRKSPDYENDRAEGHDLAGAEAKRLKVE